MDIHIPPSMATDTKIIVNGDNITIIGCLSKHTVDTKIDLAKDNYVTSITLTDNKNHPIKDREYYMLIQDNMIPLFQNGIGDLDYYYMESLSSAKITISIVNTYKKPVTIQGRLSFSIINGEILEDRRSSISQVSLENNTPIYLPEIDEKSSCVLL